MHSFLVGYILAVVGIYTTADIHITIISGIIIRVVLLALVTQLYHTLLIRILIQFLEAWTGGGGVALISPGLPANNKLNRG